MGLNVNRNLKRAFAEPGDDNGAKKGRKSSFKRKEKNVKKNIKPTHKRNTSKKLVKTNGLSTKPSVNSTVEISSTEPTVNLTNGAIAKPSVNSGPDSTSPKPNVNPTNRTSADTTLNSQQSDVANSRPMHKKMKTETKKKMKRQTEKKIKRETKKKVKIVSKVPKKAESRVNSRPDTLEPSGQPPSVKSRPDTTTPKPNVNPTDRTSADPNLNSQESDVANSQPMNKKMKWETKRKMKIVSKVPKKAESRSSQGQRDSYLKATQQHICEKLYTHNEDKVTEPVGTHDSGHVIEHTFGSGSEMLNSELFEKFKGDIFSQMSTKYGSYVVEKLLQDGNQQIRNEIVKVLCKKVPKLSVRFRVGGQPEKMDTFLKSMKSILTLIVKESVIISRMVHHILWKYLINCSHEDRSEMIRLLRDKVVHILSTNYGARVGMQCVWHGTTEDRRIIIESFKDHIHEICLDKRGHMVLISIFDCVDDTELVQKAIIDEMGRTITTLPFDTYGSKVLLFLLAPRHSLHFDPYIIKILTHGDGNSTSKKDPELRRKELLTAISKYLLALPLETVEAMVFSQPASIVLHSLLINCVGDSSHFLKLIADMAARPLETEDEKHQHIVEHAAGHALLRGLIQQDEEEFKNKAVLCDLLLSSVPTPNLQSWINCANAPFILISLLDMKIPMITEKVRGSLQPVMSTLSEKKSKGAELLYSKLNA